jgi:hypothetical protein
MDRLRGFTIEAQKWRDFKAATHHRRQDHGDSRVRECAFRSAQTVHTYGKEGTLIRALEDDMSHSLLTADPRTHVKIVVVALVGAILVVVAGIAAHVNANSEIARLQAHGPVLKASRAVSYTGQSDAVVR